MRSHGVVWVWGVELFVYLSLLGGLNYVAYRSDPGFRTFPVSLYFIPILLLALRHGTMAGLIAGTASAILVCVLQGSWSFVSGELVLPALFIVAGTLVGGSVSGLVHRIRHYRGESGHREAEFCQALRRVEVQDTALRELQRTIELDGIPVETLLRLSRGIESQQPAQRYAALLEFITLRFRVDRVGVYGQEGEGFILLDQRVSPGEPNIPATLRVDGGLVALALRLDRPVSILDVAERTDAIWCAPLHEENRVCALLLIERMPLVKCIPGTMAELAHLVAWVEQAMERARVLRVAQHSSMHGPQSEVKSAAYLREHLRHELVRYRRYRTEFALLLVRIAGYDSLPDPDRTRRYVDVARAIRSSTRASDLVFATDREDTLAVIAHTLTNTHAPTVKRRITEAAKEISLHSSDIYASQVAGEPEEMLAQAERGLPHD